MVYVNVPDLAFSYFGRFRKDNEKLYMPILDVNDYSHHTDVLFFAGLISGPLTICSKYLLQPYWINYFNGFTQIMMH